ncbi:uncharacterized protein LOC116055975 isoform X1 [Sander lucioperca]|uniref:uncharacterized protein LOC116055975 isoform X1 n=1 Tax=Sander lucioperca TaxID=283035 RepID=UPI001653EA98|nr:uncharacterized protein LOC116055975 isoform X1 [Sander lucioperca]
MATWFPTSAVFFYSLLLIIALLSRNVCCFPAKKGWSQYGPYEGSFSNMEARPDFHDGSSQSAPAQPSIVSYPAVSFPSESMEKGVDSSPGSYAASLSPIPVMSSDASWYAAPGWGIVQDSATTYTASRTSQPRSNIGLPPQPFFQASELDQYEAYLDHGNWESEELSYPQLPLSTYPELGFQPGELHLYSSILEHGNEEREPEEQGFMPLAPYAFMPQGLSTASTSQEGPMQLVAQELTPVGPSQYHILTGRLPPGKYSLLSQTIRKAETNGMTPKIH